MVVFGMALLNGERYDFPVPDGKVIIDGDRTAIKGSRYFHGDDDFRIPAGYVDRLELELVFLDGFHNPAFNGFFLLKCFSFVMDEHHPKSTQEWIVHRAYCLHRHTL